MLKIRNLAGADSTGSKNTDETTKHHHRLGYVVYREENVVWL